MLVPLFSIPSSASWGIGEIPDLPRFARWIASAGLDIVQLLPVNEMAEGQSSPYAALSAMAIDPVFIAVAEIPEFVDAGGERSLSDTERAALADVRRSRAIDYGTVRAVKTHALRAAFDRFEHLEWRTNSSRAANFAAFTDRERWWLDDYALFRTLHDENDARYWIEWEPGIRNREPAALDAARARLEADIRYYMWLQWLASEQWDAARRDCGHVGIFGDFPFVVSGGSADVWARQHEFRIDASVGVPPDAFSETGQDWGLPLYRWDVIEAGGDEWIRQRVRRCDELYDGFRIDHLVGFYRTFYRLPGGSAHFSPPDEPSQLAQGERLMARFTETGARVIAEDLGTVPDFVRASIAQLRIPGMRVLRWERMWHTPGQPFRDPRDYPAVSVATTGTHDTDPLAEWWDAADATERRQACDIPMLRDAGISPEDAYSPKLRDALLEALFAAGSDLVLLPVQDAFGWRDRINTPASVSDDNWTWRLPWPVDTLIERPESHERAEFLRRLAARRGILSSRNSAR